MESLIERVMKSTIGSDIVSSKPADKPETRWIKLDPSKPDPTPEELEQRRIAKEKFYAYLGDRHDPFNISMLTDEDIHIIQERTGLINEDKTLAKGYDFFFSNDRILRMRSSKASWMCLAGRDYYYDLDKKELHLWCMS